MEIVLYRYQEIAALWIQTRVERREVTIVDAKMGLGKTYFVSAGIQLARKRAIVVCPKSAIPHWQSVMERMGVTVLAIINYESIRTGKMYSDDTYTTRIRSPYYQPSTGWALPIDSVLVFDECHRAKNPNSDNGKMLIASKRAHDRGVPIILVSATIAEVPSDAKIILYLLKISALPKQSLAMLRSGASQMLRGVPKEEKERRLMEHLGTILMPHTHQIVLEPSEQIAFQNLKSVVFGIVACADQIEAYYRRIKRYQSSECALPKIQKLRQKIELARMILFLERIEIGREHGYSLIIFVSYLASAEFLLESYPEAGYIRGGQSIRERARIIEQFQRNELTILICQTAAGGECISLHDLSGDHPRMVLISCPDTATALVQLLGRGDRVGRASDLFQLLIFLYGVSYEQRAARRIEQKLDNLASLRNDDLP